MTEAHPSQRDPLDFSGLVEAIRSAHARCASRARRAVNVNLTLRNWLIAWYIVEYEQRGADRAEYGERMMDRLSAELRGHGVPTCERQRLYAYIAFYRAYPQIGEVIPVELVTREAEEHPTEKVRSLTGKTQAATHSAQIVQAATGQLPTSGSVLVTHLSYTHLELLAALETPLQRGFYEIECIRGNWSVRTLKRQIASLYFERSGLSEKPDKLAAMTHARAEQVDASIAIRDPYVFEFLGLRAKDAVSESHLEQGLLDNLQDFLLELGNGFCFEARQKSILIGKTRGFVDLVFYHRILKCHVLIELKVDEFTHEHLGQLNTYVTWYRKHQMVEGDNPPIGLLLCTGKDQAFVEYALAGMDNRLFVSKYQLELPGKEALQRFLDEKRQEVEADNLDRQSQSQEPQP